MATRTNGVVQSVSSNGAAVVRFPNPTPPPENEDVTYTDLTISQREAMNTALAGVDLKVDVTTEDGTTPANVTGVVAHR